MVRTLALLIRIIIIIIILSGIVWLVIVTDRRIKRKTLPRPPGV